MVPFLAPRFLFCLYDIWPAFAFFFFAPVFTRIMLDSVSFFLADRTLTGLLAGQDTTNYVSPN